MKSSLTKPLYGLIGHRGVAGHAPENTIASLKAAHDMGLNWVEIDVRQDKNGELVIFHDPTLNRTTNGDGPITLHGVNELKNLDAGSWFSSKFEGEKIPTLIEALNSLIKLKLNANLEVKCPPTPPKAQMKRFATDLSNTLKAHWPPHLMLPLVSSFNIPFLRIYKEIAPDSPVGVLADKLSDDILKLVRETSNCTLNCGARYLTPKKVEEISNSGIPLLIYTINDKKIGQDFLNAGAFGIFSDKPDVFFD